jgi:hypothetical protein
VLLVPLLLTFSPAYQQKIIEGNNVHPRMKRLLPKILQYVSQQTTQSQRDSITTELALIFSEDMSGEKRPAPPDRGKGEQTVL